MRIFIASTAVASREATLPSAVKCTLSPLTSGPPLSSLYFRAHSYDLLGTMVIPERDAEGRLCTLIVPARMNLNPGVIIIIIIVIVLLSHHLYEFEPRYSARGVCGQGAQKRRVPHGGVSRRSVRAY